MKTLLLSQSEVRQLLNMKDTIAVVEEAYKSFNQNLTIQPPIVSIEIKKHNGEIDIKAGYSIEIKPGRENNEEITIFDSTGMSIQDNLTACRIFEDAVRLGIGQKIELL